MKKMTTALLFLAAALTAGELYFTSDTISFGNKVNWAEETGDFYPFESELINETDDTIYLDSTTVDSFTNSGFTSCDYIDTMSQSLIWKQLGMDAGMFRKKNMDTVRTAQHNSKPVLPTAAVNADYYHCENGNKWQHLAGTAQFDKHVVRIWVHTTTYYRRNGITESIPMVIGGYLFDYKYSVSIQKSTKISPPQVINQRADRNIYNMRGQVVGTNSAGVEDLAPGVVVQKKNKMNTQLYQKAE